MPRDPHPVTLSAAEEVRPLLAGDGLELTRRQVMVQLLALSEPPPPARPTWWRRLVPQLQPLGGRPRP